MPVEGAGRYAGEPIEGTGYSVARNIKLVGMPESRKKGPGMSWLEISNR